MVTESVTERWEAFLAKHKVNQTGVAKRAGISPPMISAYKAGVSRPSPETLKRIAEAFDEDYVTLREQLYPSAPDDEAERGSSQSRPDRDTATTRLACIAAAAKVFSGSGADEQAVITLAEALEQWVLRP